MLARSVPQPSKEKKGRRNYIFVYTVENAKHYKPSKVFGKYDAKNNYSWSN
jgi:hypothetical protein